MTTLQAVLDELAGEYPFVRELAGQLDGLGPLVAQVGLRLMDAGEVREVRAARTEEAADPYDNLLFLVADPGGHYLGPWLRGMMQGRVSWYHPDEIDLAPVYRSVWSFGQAIATRAPDVTLFSELRHDLPDVEGRATPAERASDRAVIERYRESLAEVDDDDTWRFFFASTIMQLTPRDELDTVMAFLDDDDVFLQERAAMILGMHRHAPARTKLEQLAATGAGNGKLAARAALKQL